MRKTLFAAVLFLCGINAFAQQNLMGTAVELKSPDIREDNSVTFRVYAPKAVTVRLTGDFLPHHIADNNGYVTEVPIWVDMNEGKDGIWEYTTEPLFSRKPEYYLVACGTADPIAKFSFDFAAALKEKGYPHETLWTDGAHTWKNWRHYLMVFAERLFK